MHISQRLPIFWHSPGCQERRALLSLSVCGLYTENSKPLSVHAVFLSHTALCIWEFWSSALWSYSKPEIPDEDQLGSISGSAKSRDKPLSLLIQIRLMQICLLYYYFMPIANCVFWLYGFGLWLSWAHFHSRRHVWKLFPDYSSMFWNHFASVVLWH